MNSATLAGFEFNLPRSNGKNRDKVRTSSDFYDLASSLYKMSEEIERNWETLSNDEKALHKTMVYRVLEAKPSLYKRLRYRWTLLHVPEDGLLQFQSAAWRLINTVLDKIEEENEQYKNDVVNALEQLNPVDNGMFVTGDNAIERLRELSG